MSNLLVAIPLICFYYLCVKCRSEKQLYSVLITKTICKGKCSKKIRILTRWLKFRPRGCHLPIQMHSRHEMGWIATESVCIFTLNGRLLLTTTTL